MSTTEDLLADIADDVHIATTHPDSGVCHGNNDGCEGGPSQVDLEAADRIFNRLPAGQAGGVETSPEPPTHATVILFKENGKYYTEEAWRIPTREEAAGHSDFKPGDMVVPYVMRYSPDFRRIADGPVLVVSQEPWGYPHLL